MRSELPIEPAAPDWEVTTLGEICRSGGGDIQTGPFGSQLHADDYVDEGIPSIMPQDIIDGRVDVSSIARITHADAERLSRYCVREGDIVYGRRGDVRRRALIRDDQDGWLCGTGCLRIRVGTRALPQYISAYLGHPAVQEWIERQAVGATMLNLNTGILSSVPVALPSRDEQEDIAAVLGVLDGKINGNERLGVLLSAATSTVVRHRVVDAEPGSSWTQGDLTSIARFVNGRAFTKDANAAGRPILRIRELNGGLSQATPYSDIDAEDDNVARHHDILFSWSGSLELYRWHGPESLINQHIFKVVPLEPYPAWFVVEWVREHMPEFQRIAKDKATTMGHIKREHLTQAAVNILPPALIAELDGEVAPLDAQIGALAAETATLRAIRDGLLPKLISGEIRVSNTDNHFPLVTVGAEELPA